MEELDSDATAGVEILGRVDCAHPSLPEKTAELIFPADRGADHIAKIRRSRRRGNACCKRFSCRGWRLRAGVRISKRGALIMTCWKLRTGRAGEVQG
jgi:hypothetical protein